MDETLAQRPVHWCESTAILQSRIDALLRMFGPITASGPADEATNEELEVPSIEMWNWFALRSLVRALMEVGQTSFQDLRGQYEFALTHNRDAPDIGERVLVELDRWAARWNLSDDAAWTFRMMVHVEAVHQVFQSALRIRRSDVAEALARWRMWTAGIDERALMGAPATAPPTEPPMVHLGEWDAATMSQSRYEEKERKKFDAALANYVAVRAGRVNAPQFEAAPKKRRPGRHFEWYIQYQVLGHSLDKIADSSDATKNAVRLGIHDVVELTGMPLRAGAKGGRPRKPRDPVIKTVKFRPQT